MSAGMRAVAVRPGRSRSAELVELPRPRCREGEALVRMLEVGIDGTDRELDAGAYGEAPPGDNLLVIGHEPLGVVLEACPGVDYVRAGDIVVPTVRRPCPARCPNCRLGEFDFCLTGDYQERGIKGLHGYLSEYVAVEADFLVRVPPDLGPVAVLVEPLAVVEKAFRQAYLIQQRMVWEPQRVLVTGAGGVGILAAMLARLHGLEVLVYSLGSATGAREKILRQIGAEYVDAKSRSLAEAVERFGAPDLAIEATGHSPVAWEVVEVLHRNGVACLLSVTGGDRTAAIPSDRLNNLLVLGNRLVFGSVNAHRRDLEQAITDLAALRDLWPRALERFITRRVPMEQLRAALDAGGEGDLKTVIEVTPGGARGGV